MLRIGQHDFSQQRLRTVMTTPPLLFNHMTQFTWVMSASTGAFDMVLADQSWRRSTSRPAFARERKTRVASGRMEWDVPKNYIEALDEDPEAVRGSRETSLYDVHGSARLAGSNRRLESVSLCVMRPFLHIARFFTDRVRSHHLLCRSRKSDAETMSNPAGF
ncbi:unnamed protein product [Prorocentrum cordatum]|uniref:Uncharacterized protein n=1 Tax=Prorocentrum cordatum TaxID=2364126 RepID=A0ABN9SUE1_9DINO|nr:unnamed protein product [Polarella glacialis]